MINSIRYRILSWFLLFSFLTTLIVIPVTITYFSKKDQINETAYAVEKLHIRYLQKLKKQQDFLAMERTNPVFFVTGSSKYLRDVNALHDSISSSFKHLLEKDDITSFAIEQHLEKSQDIFERQNEIFNRMTVLLKKRGFKDYGIVGRMREEVHKLEDYSQVDQVKVLTLRRHEKDYIIRHQQQYILKHLETGKELLGSIARNPNLSTEEKELLAGYTNAYLGYFGQMTELDRVLWYGDDPLEASFKRLSNQIESEFNQLIDKTNNRRTELAQQLLYYYIMFVFFLIIASVLISLYASRIITKPIIRLTNHMEDVVDSDFKLDEPIRHRVKDQELNILYRTFNKMIEQLKARQKERDNALQAVQEGEKKFRELAGLLPQPVFEVNNDFEFTYANKTLLQLFKINEHNENIYRGLSELMVNPGRQQFKRLRQGETIELAFNATDGSSFTGLVTVNPIYHEDQVTGYRGIIIDITKRKQYIRRLEEAKKKAEEADNLKTAFLANMSHEIRTPMNAIIGFTELLAEEKDEDERQWFIKLITTNSHTLLNLINDIIDLSKIEAGQLTLAPEETDINDMMRQLNETFKELRTSYNKLHIEFSLDMPENKHHFVMIDRMRVMQVLTNFLNNAMKFTEKGSIRMGYYMKSEHRMYFYVQDTGIGIPKEKQSEIFQRFRKFDSENHKIFRGAGLGLSICSNLVEMMGGKIGVKSTENIGSLFWFEIPVRKIEAVRKSNHEAGSFNS